MAMLRRLPLAGAVVGCATTLTPCAWAAAPWVDRHLTLPRHDWAFDFGLGVGHTVDDRTQVGVNYEMAVGITSRVELGVRSGVRFGDGNDRAANADDYGRLFDRQTLPLQAAGAEPLANPEVLVRGALVRERVVELALEGRVVLPFANESSAGLLFGVPLSFHLGDVVRLDTGAYVPIVFVRHDTTVALRVPVDVWIQASSRFWLGPMTGVALDRLGENGSSTDISLGFGLGYEITHAVDFKAMFLFPTLNNDSGRDFGFGAGIEVRIE